MPVTQLAWMAGVIETRGKVRRIDNPLRASTQLVLQVQTRHLHVVSRLCAMTATEPWMTTARTIVAGDRRGCVEHCPEPHVHLGAHMPAMAKWSVTGTAAAIVLYNLEPYLDPATNLAVVAEILAQLPREGRGAAAIAASIMRLTQLGWQLPPELDDFDLARWLPARTFGRRAARQADTGPGRCETPTLDAGGLAGNKERSR